MNEPVYITRPWRSDELAHEQWFMFEDKVFVQRSKDGYEWEEPELTPYDQLPFVVIRNLPDF